MRLRIHIEGAMELGEFVSAGPFNEAISTLLVSSGGERLYIDAEGGPPLADITRRDAVRLLNLCQPSYRQQPNHILRALDKGELYRRGQLAAHLFDTEAMWDEDEAHDVGVLLQLLRDILLAESERRGL